MKRKTLLLGAIALVLSAPAGFAAAQAAAPAASAPQPGMGAGMGGGMRGGHMSRDNTPGWSLMTRAERREHHDKMMSMTDRTACDAYMEQHHARMLERAKDKGRPMPDKPRHDPCAALKSR
jgi:Spy/CpxP family protein refolding chaperone